MSDDAIDAALAALRPTYLARRREDSLAIASAIEVGDLDAVARVSHKVAGSAATYGFAELSAIAKELEAACLEQRPDDARAQCDAFAAHLLTLS